MSLLIKFKSDVTKEVLGEVLRESFKTAGGDGYNIDQVSIQRNVAHLFESVKLEDGLIILSFKRYMQQITLYLRKFEELMKSKGFAVERLMQA